MWNGVMRMDDVEPELARDLDDSIREREQVLRLAKERIGRRQHLMEGESRLELTEAERCFRADEMDLVATAGERLAKLGRNDAAAPDRGIADDADIHALMPCERRSPRSS